MTEPAAPSVEDILAGRVAPPCQNRSGAGSRQVEPESVVITFGVVGSTPLHAPSAESFCATTLEVAVDLAADRVRVVAKGSGLTAIFRDGAPAAPAHPLDSAPDWVRRTAERARLLARTSQEYFA